MSQPVRACELGLGDLSKPTAAAYFWGGKVNVCRCHVNVCQCHEFPSSSKNKARRCENFLVKFLPIFVILIRSSELASKMK